MRLTLSILLLPLAAFASHRKADPGLFAQPRELDDSVIEKADNRNWSQSGCYWHLVQSTNTVNTYRSGVWQSSQPCGTYETGLGSLWKSATTITTLIAVVDTPVMTTHPDFSGITFTSTNYASLGIDADHGTRVASIICARWDGQRAAGVGQCSRLITCGVNYSEPQIVDACEFAIQHGAQIVVCAWGFSSEPLALKEVIAENPSVLFVCSTPNDQRSLDTSTDWPSSWGFHNVVPVSNVDRYGNQFWSATGSQVSLLAPGRDVCVSTWFGYGYATGTSYSAPYVSGVIGLVASRLGCDVFTALRLIEATAVDKRLQLANVIPSLRIVRDGDAVVVFARCPPGWESRIGWASTLPIPAWPSGTYFPYSDDGQEHGLRIPLSVAANLNFNQRLWPLNIPRH